MATTFKGLAQGALSSTLTVTLYTTPAATTTELTSVTLCNTNTTTARNVTLDVNSRKVLAARPLAPGETLVIRPGIGMATGVLIRGGQDTGTDVEYTLSGVEFT